MSALHVGARRSLIVCARRARAVGGLALVLLACAHAPSPPPPRSTPPQPLEPHEVVAALPAPSEHARAQTGYATWYGGKLAGHKTANGERFDPNQMTAAHRSLPFGTWVEVKRVDTGESVRVRITDRGPFGHEERIIDLSRAAAKRLGMLNAGLVKVELRVVDGPR